MCIAANDDLLYLSRGLLSGPSLNKCCPQALSETSVSFGWDRHTFGTGQTTYILKSHKTSLPTKRGKSLWKGVWGDNLSSERFPPVVSPVRKINYR